MRLVVICAVAGAERESHYKSQEKTGFADVA